MEVAKQTDIIHPASKLSDIQLTATLPHEMVNAQQQLITWCENKIVVLKLESDELKLATEHAKKMKWKYSTLQNQYNRSIKKISYYEKIKSALVEGYYIVPNFPIQMFAIRTKKTGVSGHSWSYWGNFEQEAQELKEGDGEYKNPFPLVRRIESKRDESYKEIRKAESYPTEWDDFEFPVTMAKPQIMEATSWAMSLKIFDRIGIMPATKKEDPVIIGQVIQRTNKYQEKIVSFMIAWHLDTRVI